MFQQSHAEIKKYADRQPTDKEMALICKSKKKQGLTLDAIRIFESEPDSFEDTDEEDLMPFQTFDFSGNLMIQQQIKTLKEKQQRRYIKQGKFMNKFLIELKANEHFN